MNVERTCQWSGYGKVFTAKSADVKRGWARYCSKSCAAKPKAKRLDRNNYADLPERGALFSNAHQFSNEEHDCNKS